MIEVYGLTKDFGNIRAVDDLTLNIEKGVVVGFLGPQSITVRLEYLEILSTLKEEKN